MVFFSNNIDFRIWKFTTPYLSVIYIYVKTAWIHKLEFVNSKPSSSFWPCGLNNTYFRKYFIQVGVLVNLDLFLDEHSIINKKGLRPKITARPKPYLVYWYVQGGVQYLLVKWFISIKGRDICLWKFICIWFLFLLFVVSQW